MGVYHERATVSVDTTWPDGATATSRFPFWGDQDDLMALLTLEASGGGAYSAPGYHVRERNVVEGGQLLGQAIAASSLSVPDQRVTWASATFARAADFNDTVDLAVEEVRRGRIAFSTLSVRSTQRGSSCLRRSFSWMSGPTT